MLQASRAVNVCAATNDVRFGEEGEVEAERVLLLASELTCFVVSVQHKLILSIHSDIPSIFSGNFTSLGWATVCTCICRYDRQLFAGTLSEHPSSRLSCWIVLIPEEILAATCRTISDCTHLTLICSSWFTSSWTETVLFGWSSEIEDKPIGRQTRISWGEHAL